MHRTPLARVNDEYFFCPRRVTRSLSKDRHSLQAEFQVLFLWQIMVEGTAHEKSVYTTAFPAAIFASVYLQFYGFNFMQTNDFSHAFVLASPQLAQLEGDDHSRHLPYPAAEPTQSVLTI
jgi:hypothetical protein